jgi:hypothetical protein
MPLKSSDKDNGEDLPISPAKRESEKLDRRTVANTRRRIFVNVKSAPAQPEVLDISKIIRRLNREGNIVCTNTVNGNRHLSSFPQFLEQTSAEFQSKVYAAICDAITKYVHYEGATLYEKIDRLRNMKRINVGLRNGKISSVFVVIEEGAEPANDTTYTESDCRDDRLRASGKSAKIIPKILN